jgi:hypothetical protein
MTAPSLSHPGAVAEALAAYLEADRLLNLGNRVLQGQRLIFADIEANGGTIPKRCRETHAMWRTHCQFLYQARAHARANLAMAEALASR